MKKCNKVFALLLAMIMLVMALPLSVFADAWVTVDADRKPAVAEGEPDSVVTVTLDPTALLELIKSKGLSTDLLFALKDGVALDKSALLEIFTVEELLEVIPKDRWLDVFDPDKIISEIGYEALLQFVGSDDYEAWVSAILDTDVDTFARLIAGIPNVEECVNPFLFYRMGYLVPTDANVVAGKTIYDLIAAHVYQPDALAGKLVVDQALIDYVSDIVNGLSQAEAEELFNIEKLYDNGFLVDDDLVDEATLRAKIVALVNDEAILSELIVPSNGYTDGVKLMEKMGAQFVLEHVEGGAAAIFNPEVVDLSPSTGLLSELDPVKSMRKVVAGITAGDISIEDAFNFDKLIAALQANGLVDDVIEMVGIETIIASFTNEELVALVRMIDLKSYVKPAITMVIGQLLDNVTELVIDGHVVASSATTGAQQLQIHADALLKALTGMVPTFDDLLAEDFDGTVFSTTVELSYIVADTSNADYGKVRHRSVALNFVLGGGDGVVAKFQSGVAKIQKLYNVYINQFGLSGTELTLDLNITPAFTELFRQILDSDQLDDEVKKKIAMIAETGVAYDFVAGDLTFENIDAILRAVDLEALYTVIRNAGYAEILLGKLDELTGSNTQEMSLQAVIDYIVKNEYALDDLCEIVKARLGYNVKAILEKASIKFDAAADRAEKIALVQKALNLIESKTGINLADVSAEALLDRAADKPIIDTIISVVSEKIGRDIDYVLSNYTAQELYDAALDKVAQYEDKAEAVLEKARALVAKVAAKYPNVTLANCYRGNGMFNFSGDVTVTPKVWLEKLVNKAVDVVGDRFSIPTAAVDLLMGCVSDSEMTISADITLRVEGLYRISFMDKDAVNDPYAAPLYSAFLPAGADLSIFENSPVTTKFDFADWWTYDENGNQVKITEMPAADTVVYTNGIDYELHIRGTEYLLLITDPYWSLGDGLKITLDRQMLDRAAAGEAVTFEVAISKDGVVTSFAKFDTATLRTLAAASEVSFYYGSGYHNAVNAGASDFDGSIYAEDKIGAASAPEYHSFKLVADGNEISAFGGEITITLPYSGAMTTNPSRTEVYTMVDGAREWIGNATLDYANKLVTFTTTHFTDFVILNSYKIDVKFVTGNGVAVDAKIKDFDMAHPYYPAGYELSFDRFYDFGDYDKIVKIVASVGGADSDYTNLTSYVLTDADVILTVTLENVYYIYYYVNGIKWDAATIEYYKSELVDGELPAGKTPKTFDELIAFVNAGSDDRFLPPAGYQTAGEWVGFNKAYLGLADMNVFAKWTPVVYSYTFNLMVGETLFDTITLDSAITDMAELLAQITLPAVPAKAGYMGEWTLVSTLANEKTVTLVATYTPKNYLIVTDGNAFVQDAAGTLHNGGLFAYGSELTVVPAHKPNYDAKVVIVYATKDADGNDVLLKTVGGKFTMPADEIYVSIVYTPKTYAYNFNGITLFGAYGESQTFELLVPADKVVSAIQGDACVLLSEKLNKDGSMTMVFGFVITKDGMSFTVEFADKTTKPGINIFNGAIYDGEGDPQTDVKNVKFDGWTKEFMGVSFAKFAFDDSQKNYLAPWILVALLIFLVLIVVLYVLHRLGKIGNNFLVAFAILVVEGFFTLCHKVAGLVLNIGHLFGKSRDAADYGFVEDEAAEELPEEEATEEIAEEATEAPAEETAEEATEEIAKEASEDEKND